MYTGLDEIGETVEEFLDFIMNYKELDCSIITDDDVFQVTVVGEKRIFTGRDKNILKAINTNEYFHEGLWQH